MVAYIGEHRGQFGVQPICRVLAGHGAAIAPGTHYAAKKRPDAAIPPRQIAKLSYTIPAGQFYPVVTTGVTTDYYYAKTFNSSLRDDHMIVIGTTPYYQIS